MTDRWMGMNQKAPPIYQGTESRKGQPESSLPAQTVKGSYHSAVFTLCAYGTPEPLEAAQPNADWPLLSGVPVPLFPPDPPTTNIIEVPSNVDAPQAPQSVTPEAEGQLASGKGNQAPQPAALPASTPPTLLDGARVELNIDEHYRRFRELGFAFNRREDETLYLKGPKPKQLSGAVDLLETFLFDCLMNDDQEIAQAIQNFLKDAKD